MTTDLTANVTFKLMGLREGRVFSVTLPSTAVGGDTFTVDGTKLGLKLKVIDGVLAQKINGATASATYSGTTVTLGGAGTVASIYTVLVWGTD